MSDIKTIIPNNRSPISLEKIKQDLFYIFGSKGRCSLKGYKNNALILIPKMIVDRLELIEKQNLYVKFDIDKEILRFSLKPKDDIETVVELIFFNSRLHIVLPKQLCLDFNIINTQMIFIFYLSSNNFFSCKKSGDMLLYQ